MILDCCFAGRISWVGKGRNAARSRKLYKQSYDRFIKYQTEQIITSAAYDEKAQDSFRFGQRGDQNGHSPFAHLLLKVLQGNSDGGKDKFIEAIVEDKVIRLFWFLCGNEVYTDTFFRKIALKVLPDKHFTIP